MEELTYNNNWSSIYSYYTLLVLLACGICLLFIDHKHEQMVSKKHGYKVIQEIIRSF
jgi:hypothetical protein